MCPFVYEQIKYLTCAVAFPSEVLQDPMRVWGIRSGNVRPTCHRTSHKTATRPTCLSRCFDHGLRNGRVRPLCNALCEQIARSTGGNCHHRWAGTTEVCPMPPSLTCSLHNGIQVVVDRLAPIRLMHAVLTSKLEIAQ